ncbi:MAG: HIT family protein [Acidobacteriaceae bacterium]|nr:HIT family protein [Acidobacteriaceae bacterium]MBV8571193.1 HIT family protein [Acidobacteriaceae bacterium]
MESSDLQTCVFCQIVRSDLAASVVYRDEDFIAFLDSHPLFPGHVLLCPVEHYVTLLELPSDIAGAAMMTTKLLAKAVESAVDAEGTFIAINNRISQTVPHLHIHIVPRRHRDGLKGFFWPRQKYRDADAREAVRDAIERQVQKLLSSGE